MAQRFQLWPPEAVESDWLPPVEWNIASHSWRHSSTPAGMTDATSTLRLRSCPLTIASFVNSILRVWLPAPTELRVAEYVR